jgi:general secretion pathway protein H
MSGARGFTLIEMLVVIAVLGLIAGIGFPAVDRALDRAEFRAAAARVELAAREARARAIGSGAPVAFGVPTGGGPIRRQGDAFALPATMRLALPPQGLRFYPDGSATGGQIVLTAPRGRMTMRVSADTGAIGVAIE